MKEFTNKTEQVEARLGGGMKLDQRHPLLEVICENWVDDVVAPRSVSGLVEELLEEVDLTAEDDSPECSSIVPLIRKAERRAVDWKAAAEEKEWKSTETLFNEMMWNRGKQHELLLVWQFLNLISDQLDSMAAPNAVDMKFYFYTHRNYDVGEGLKMVPLAQVHEHFTRGVALEVGWVTPEYSYQQREVAYRFSRSEPCKTWQCHKDDLPYGPREHDKFVREALGRLPDEYFVEGHGMRDELVPVIVAWLRAEWIDTMPFVNFGQAEWSHAETWEKLCGEQDIEPDEPDVHQWFSVSDRLGRNLPADAITLQLPGGSWIWGRQSSGVAIHYDPDVFSAMVESGWLDWVPPLGLLDPKKVKEFGPKKIRVDLRGDLYPFRIDVPGSDEPGDDDAGRASAFMGWLTEEAMDAGCYTEWIRMPRWQGDSQWGFRIKWPSTTSGNPVIPDVELQP